MPTLKKIIIDEIDEELNKIKFWNVETFKDATLEGQLLNLEEVFVEMSLVLQDEEKAIKELADVFIVLGGLRRFDSKIGKVLFAKMLQGETCKGLFLILSAIRNKMDINKARTWKKSGDGVYHH